MIDCNVAKQLMPDHVSGLTTAEIKSEMEEHISECEDCRKLYEEMKLVPESEDKLNQSKPFRKIQKKIIILKAGKRIASVIAIILAITMAIFIIGEIKPKTNLPSITRITYKQKCREIVNNFINGDVGDIMASGRDRMSPFADSIHAEIREKMISDYTPLISELAHKVFDGHTCNVGPIELEYCEAERFKGYVANIQITTEESSLYTIYLSFVAPDVYEFSFHDESSDIFDSTDKYYENTQQYSAADQLTQRLSLFAFGMIPHNLNDDIFYYLTIDPEEDDFPELTLQNIQGIGSIFSTDFSSFRVKGSGQSLSEQLPERFLKIRDLSTTKASYFRLVDYSFDNHGQIYRLFWELTDKYGHSAIYTKDFYLVKRGRANDIGYETVDNSYALYTEDGFDENLKKLLAEFFILQ